MVVRAVGIVVHDHHGGAPPSRQALQHVHQADDEFLLVERVGVAAAALLVAAGLDTNATSPENDTAGGWTGVFKLTQHDPSASTGTLTLFYKDDEAHAGFDNVAFLSHDLVTFVEDAGDGLHSQRNALDSAYVLNLRTDYSNTNNQPVRWLAEGRDPSATIDSANGGFGKNEGDNELTGAHVSNGDPSTNGILGARDPKLGHDGWRWFYTQQHGDNPTYEVLLDRHPDVH